MIYKVTAALRTEKAAEFRRLLSEGAIAAQKPDGEEIVASMKRAVMTAQGTAQWSELCYCRTPLLHERATVLDRFFSDIETEIIDTREIYEGPSFLDYLDEMADR